MSERPSIAFPAIVISDAFWVAHTLDTHCTYHGWKSGWFDSLSYFDSSGLEWRVKQATLNRPPSLLDRLFGGRFTATIEFEDPVAGDLDLLKDRLCSWIEGAPDDLYDQFVSDAVGGGPKRDLAAG